MFCITCVDAVLHFDNSGILIEITQYFNYSDQSDACNAYERGQRYITFSENMLRKSYKRIYAEDDDIKISVIQNGKEYLVPSLYKYDINKGGTISSSGNILSIYTSRYLPNLNLAGDYCYFNDGIVASGTIISEGLPIYSGVETQEHLLKSDLKGSFYRMLVWDWYHANDFFYEYPSNSYFLILREGGERIVYNVTDFQAYAKKVKDTHEGLSVYELTEEKGTGHIVAIKEWLK